jgi:hypothetical protein
MRGSSDLESFWETRLRWKRDGQSPLIELESEHREAEASPALSYRIKWDAETRSMRFGGEASPSLADRIVAHLRDRGAGTTAAVQKGVGVRKADVLRTLEELEKAGTTHRGRSGRLDRLGRPIRDQVWNLTDQAGLWPVPDSGTATGTTDNGHRGSVARPVSIETGGTEQPPDDPRDPPEEADTQSLLTFVDTIAHEEQDTEVSAA